MEELTVDEPGWAERRGERRAELLVELTDPAWEVAGGLHTLCVHQRLAVAGPYAQWAVVAWRRMTDMSLPRPVRPGGTLTGWVAIGRVSPRARNAMARIHGELINRNGEQVLGLELDAVVKNRPAARSDRAR
ncbi:hypothetical protein [Streptomyces adustus]|uniref:hypothetical protein n=1 Tax=Streptomyces adustus TaxID=1609272 RepID=UPI0037131465